MLLVKPCLSFLTKKPKVIIRQIHSVMDRPSGGGALHSVSLPLNYDNLSYRQSSMKWTGEVNRIRLVVKGKGVDGYGGFVVSATNLTQKRIDKTDTTTQEYIYKLSATATDGNINLSSKTSAFSNDDKCQIMIYAEFEYQQ